MGAEMRKSDGVRVCDLYWPCIGRLNSELQNTRVERPAVHRTRHLGFIEQEPSTSSVNATEDGLPLEQYKPRCGGGRRRRRG